MKTVNTTEVVQFTFSIFGVPGFTSVVANGASVRKRMAAALNQIDREVSEKVKGLGTDRRSWGPTAHANMHAYDRVSKLMVEIKDVMKRETEEAKLPLQLEEYVNNMSTEEFLEKGGDTYAGNTALFLEKLSDLEKGSEAFFDNRMQSREGGTNRPSFTMFVPQLYQCTGGIFGKDKFHIILSLETIRTLDIGGSVVEAVKRMCREHITSVKSFLLTDFVRDVKNRDKIKQRILETDALYNQVDDVHVYHLSRLFAERTPAVLRSQGKADDIMPKVSRVMQNESRELLQNYVMGLCNGGVTFASTEQELPSA